MLLEIGDKVPGPIDLNRGNEVFAQPCDTLDQVVAPLDRIEGPCEHAAMLVYQEVGIRRLEECVIFCGLDVEFRGNRDLAARPGAGKTHP